MGYLREIRLMAYVHALHQVCLVWLAYLGSSFGHICHAPWFFSKYIYTNQLKAPLTAYSFVLSQHTVVLLICTFITLEMGIYFPV